MEKNISPAAMESQVSDDSQSASLSSKSSSSTVVSDIAHFVQELKKKTNPKKYYLYAYMMVESFMNGYVDLVTYLLFGVYTVTITGNLALLAIVLGQQSGPNWVTVAFISTVTFAYFLGCYIAYYLIGNNENPARSFNWMAPFQVFSLILVIVVPGQMTHSEFSVIPLLISFGMVNTWSNKQGYVPQGMTGNVHRIAETLYKRTFNEKWTNEQEQTDFKVISLIFLIYFSGCVASVFVINAFSFTTLDPKRGALIVILALVPVKYFLTDSLNLCGFEESKFDDQKQQQESQQVAIDINMNEHTISRGD